MFSLKQVLLPNTGSGTAVVFVSKFVVNEQCGSPDVAGWMDQVTYRALGSHQSQKQSEMHITEGISKMKE